MAIGFLTDEPRILNPINDGRPQPASALEAPSHVTGKPTEREPLELASADAEAPEAAGTPVEAPDAGYGRCTESSDWEERGRS